MIAVVWFFYFKQHSACFLCMCVECMTLISRGWFLVAIVWSISLNPLFLASFFPSSSFAFGFVFALYTCYIFSCCVLFLGFPVIFFLRLFWCWHALKLRGSSSDMSKLLMSLSVYSYHCWHKLFCCSFRIFLILS